MIRKSVKRFSKRSCSNKKVERDDNSKISHRALAEAEWSGTASRKKSSRSRWPHTALKRLRTSLRRPWSSVSIAWVAREGPPAPVAICPCAARLRT